MAYPDDWARKCRIDLAEICATPILLSEISLPSEMLDSDGTYPALSDGGDIRFTEDSAGNTKLPCEVVNFTQNADPSLAVAEIWVKPPSGTVFYVWYNAASKSQPANTANTDSDGFQGSNYVWSQFDLVSHCNEDPGGTAPQINDATDNGFAGTTAGTMTSADLVDDIVTKAIEFDSNDKITFSNSALLAVSEDFTIDIFAKPSGIGDMCYIGKGAAGDAGWLLWQNSGLIKFWKATTSASTYSELLSSVVAPVANTTKRITVTQKKSIRNSLAVQTFKQTHAGYCTYNSKMYVFGGHSGAYTSPIAKVSVYNPSTNTFEASRTDMPTARTGPAAFEISGIIYTVGGLSSGGATSVKNEAYDVSSNSWTTKADIPAGLGGQGVTAISYGGYGYVISGLNFYKYDPTGDSWTALAAPSANQGTYATLAVLGDYIYMFDGSNKNGFVKQYNIASDSWSNTFDTMPTMTEFSSAYSGWAYNAEVYDGDIYVAMGRSGGALQDDYKCLWKYEPGTTTWTRLTDDSLEGNALASAVISGKLYIFGSRFLGPIAAQKLINLVDYHSCYNLTTNEWETASGTLCIWVDGVKKAYLDAVTNCRQASAYCVAANYNGSFQFTGRLDEMRISNQSLEDSILIEQSIYDDPGSFFTVGTPSDGDADSTLSPISITQGISLSAVELTQKNILAAQNLTQANAADSIVLTLAQLLEIYGLTQVQGISGADLLQKNNLVLNNLAQAQAASAVDLFHKHLLTVQGVSHGQLTGEVVLSLSGILAVANMLQSQSIDGTDITQAHNLTVNGLIQPHLLGSVNMALDLLLEVAGLSQGQTLEAPDLSALTVLAVDNLGNTQNLGEMSLVQASNLLVNVLSQNHNLSAVSFVTAVGKVTITFDMKTPGLSFDIKAPSVNFNIN